MSTNANFIDVFTTTPLQSGMLYYDIMHPKSTIYTQQYRFVIEGNIDFFHFIHAWNEAFQTFPAMRTSFHWEGLSKPLQVIHKQVPPPLVTHDLRTLSEEERNQFIETFAEKDRQTGFLLDTPPLVRMAIFRLRENRLQMMLTLHHIITDGWSLGLLFSEFFRVYAAKRQSGTGPSQAAPSMKRYVEYLQTKDSSAARQWWQAFLHGAKPSPLPRSSGSELPLGEGTTLREDLVFSPEETRELVHVTKEMGITLNVLFQAGWAATLAAKTGRAEALFALCIASRPPEVDHIESVYGPLLSIVPMRAGFGEESVRRWLCGLRDTLLSAMAHSHLPLTELRKLCQDEGDGTFLGSMTVFENFPVSPGPELPFDITPLPGFERTSYPLTVLGYPEEAMRLAVIFDASLFGAEDVRALLAHMREAMLRMVRKPEESVRRLFLPSKTVHQPGLSLLRGEVREFPPLNPWERFSHLAYRQGEQTALVLVGGPSENSALVSYAELYKRSLTIATALHARSFSHGDLAAIRLEPGVDAVASMLAVWRLGGAWIPLPLNYPHRFAENILKVAGVRALLTKGGSPADAEMADVTLGVIPDAAYGVVDLSALPFVEPNLPLFAGAAPGDTACIMYTSGSTGTPKGVCLSHRAMGNRLHWMWETFPWQEGERACAKTTMAFVDFIWELFGSLLAGVPVVLPSSSAAVDTAELFSIVQRYSVTRLILTPSVLAAARQMQLVQSHCQGVSVITSSGEPLSLDLANTIHRDVPTLRLLNLYGSTETMGDATWYEFVPVGEKTEPHQSVSIGSPIANSRVAVLDENDCPVPFGEIGELAISGDCLADGYHKDTPLTDGVFKPLPVTGGEKATLWFATGDMGYMNASRQIFCLGRKDRQIKIRGVRVDPGEVAACLKEHPLVKDALVRAVTDSNGKMRLAGYVIANTRKEKIAKGRGTSLVEQLEAHVRERMMAPKRPDTYIFLDEWPATVSHKVDLNRLPNPFEQHATLHGEPPLGEMENTLAGIWRSLLGVTHITRQDDFFELGGDSLSVTQLAFELRKVFNRQIPFQHLYQVPRLKDMATYLIEPDVGAEDRGNPFFLSMPPDAMIDEDVHAADAFSPLPTASPQPLEEGACVLLTGVPGHISLWLVTKLLERGAGSVLCLEEHDFAGELTPMESLRDRLTRAGCWKEEYAARLSVISGRLGSEYFGLPQAAWDNLAESVDVVFHCGLHVNLAQSYQHLRGVNIGGTKEVIRFCCHVKTKPLHYISSHAIIDTSAHAGSETALCEDAELVSYKGLPGGYILSRWAMERMIWLARQRGLPSAIYRYVPVSGDSVTHQCDTSEIYWRLLRLFCQTGAIPENLRPVNILPVDTAADLVLTIASDPYCYKHAFHICNPRSESWSVWAEYLRKLGYPTSVMSNEEWFHFFTGMPEKDHDDNSRILLSFLGKMSKSPLKHLPIAMENTCLMMEKHGVVVPPFSFKMFAAYWRVMRDKGWLPGPGEKQDISSAQPT